MKLLLAICQKQGTRSPYTGAGKTGGLSEYARLVGKGQSYITQVRQAAEVYGTVKTHYSGNMFQDKVENATGGAGKTGGLSEYARLVGKSQQHITQMRQAAEVFQAIENLQLELYLFQDKAKLGLSLRNDNLTWSHHKEGAQHAPGCVLSDVKAIG